MLAFGARSAPPKKQKQNQPVCANPENPTSVGQAAGLSDTGGAATPVGVAASDWTAEGLPNGPVKAIGFHRG